MRIYRCFMLLSMKGFDIDGDAMESLNAESSLRAMNTEKLRQYPSMADKTLTLHSAN